MMYLREIKSTSKIYPTEEKGWLRSKRSLTKLSGKMRINSEKIETLNLYFTIPSTSSSERCRFTEIRSRSKMSSFRYPNLIRLN